MATTDLGRLLLPPVLLDTDAAQLNLALQQAQADSFRLAQRPTDILAGIFDAAALKRLGDALGSPVAALSPAALTSLLTAVGEHLAVRSHLTLTLAFRPRPAFVQELIAWFTAHGPRPCILTLTVDPAIVAGVIIDWQGREHRQCLAASLDAYDYQRLTTSSRQAP